LESVGLEMDFHPYGWAPGPMRNSVESYAYTVWNQSA